MASCSQCGSESNADSRYCADCGHRLRLQTSSKEPNPSDPSTYKIQSHPADNVLPSGSPQDDSERTIRARVKDGYKSAIHHFNVDNIAYIEITDVELTSLAMALIFGVSLSVFVVLLTQTSWLVGLILAGIVGVAIAALISELDSVSLGTLTQKHKLKGGQPSRIEKKFLDRSKQVLSIEGSTKSPYNTFTFRYHFVPDNIVSIQYISGRSYPVPLILAGFGILMFFLVQSWFDSILSGTILLGVFLVAAHHAEPYEKLDKIRIELQSDEDIEFQMPTEDAKELVEEFQYRSEEMQDAVKLKHRAEENPDAVDVG